MHDGLTIGIPLIAILFGVLLNQQGLRDLRATMESRFSILDGHVNSRFNAVDSRLDRMQADLAGFYRT